MSALLQELKASSSQWLKRQSVHLAGFAWQRGYGAFSVSPAEIDGLLTYISGQEEHHRTRSFQEEYRGFLAAYQVPYDESMFGISRTLPYHETHNE